MTAVPGAPAPRRLPLSGPFAALAFIAVGLRLMGTLRVRTWQLWGAKTADHRCFIIRTPPPQFQIVIFPRFVGNSDVTLFCKTRAGPPVAVQSADSNADNSRQIHRKPGDSPGDPPSGSGSHPAGSEKAALVMPPPAIRATAQHCHRAREQASCKNKARRVRPGSSLVNYAEYDALLHRSDFPE